MTRNCYATFMLTFFLQLIFYINKSEANQSPSRGRKNHDTTYDITEGGYPMSEVSNGGNSRHYMSSMAPEIISEPQSEIIYQASKGTMLECMTKLTHTQVKSWIDFIAAANLQCLYFCWPYFSQLAYLADHIWGYAQNFWFKAKKRVECIF